MNKGLPDNTRIGYYWSIFNYDLICTYKYKLYSCTTRKQGLKLPLVKSSRLVVWVRIMGTGTGMGTRPWVWVRVRVRDHGYGYRYGYGPWVRVWVWVRHVTKSWVRVRVWVRDHRYGYGYGYGTMGMGTMGTGMGTGPGMSSRRWKTVCITIATQHCTWVPNRIWDFGEESHCD